LSCSGYQKLEQKFIREKLKACYTSIDDGSSGDFIDLPSLPSNHEKWK